MFVSCDWAALGDRPTFTGRPAALGEAPAAASGNVLDLNTNSAMINNAMTTPAAGVTTTTICTSGAGAAVATAVVIMAVVGDVDVLVVDDVNIVDVCTSETYINY